MLFSFYSQRGNRVSPHIRWGIDAHIERTLFSSASGIRTPDMEIGRWIGVTVVRREIDVCCRLSG